ncbi:DUF4197 domain-containing protein [Rhodanobacter sp. FDAARGOS 1247]|uniref:DUF4197 domain-containing protein n=1 Tax=Rhodanobacter sp. FDAARGOS 1247 TaxID=2778082 RepID=UPI00195239D1|nr:DUF4197 domain-containing protein [Rhodanobacter sp. FDAARGOS 1247]QRP64590.1 DUF4197 domain-containing protein [Rhodanobacter sp. FDAARGOS 1247]
MRIAIRHGVFGLAFAAAMVPLTAMAAGQFKDLLNKVKQSTHSSNSSQPGSNLPNSDIAAGLKEALAKGTTNAINSLGRDGGFWNNSKVRIPLPGKLEQAGKLARQLGQGARVDAFELSMNRAAEKAVPQVAEIFGDAIRKMTLSDARGILTGGDHAATDFFRRVAGDALTARIHPIVARTTDSVGVTQKYKSFTSGSAGGELGGLLGSLGGGKSNRNGNALDLDDYVTKKTLDGLFTTIGEQEQSIRHNPGARTTDLLKKVFGG